MEQISREKEEAQTLSVKVMYGYNDWVVSTSGICTKFNAPDEYSMHTIISSGLYIFNPFFTAVSSIYRQLMYKIYLFELIIDCKKNQSIRVLPEKYLR